MTEPRDEYKVALENFAGPLDLLLYLIRKEEVDIRDIPISRILTQYMSYIEALKVIDLDDAGDFLVMASTLMVIKSKMLLPVEEVDLAEELDPRFELVQQLLEYKRIRERTRYLETLEDIQARRVGRPDNVRPEAIVDEDRSLDKVEVWDLLKLFAKIMSETGGNVQKDRVLRKPLPPVREYANRLQDKLKAGPVKLGALLREQPDRHEAIGFFLAVLLLLKTQLVHASAGTELDEIEIKMNGADRENAERDVELEDDFKG